jgi:hypothetical protein
MSENQDEVIDNSFMIDLTTKALRALRSTKKSYVTLVPLSVLSALVVKMFTK